MYEENRSIDGGDFMPFHVCLCGSAMKTRRLADLQARL
jgi:hypothetical protein